MNISNTQRRVLERMLKAKYMGFQQRFVEKKQVELQNRPDVKEFLKKYSKLQKRLHDLREETDKAYQEASAVEREFIKNNPLLRVRQDDEVYRVQFTWDAHNTVTKEAHLSQEDFLKKIWFSSNEKEVNEFLKLLDS